MYDHVLRQPKRIVYQPLAKRIPLSPNLITLLGLLPGLAAALACLGGFYRVALWLWILNRLLDGLDGEVARAQNKQSDLGGYLDILADLFVYAAIPMAIAIHWNTTSIWFACCFMLMSFYLNVGSWMYLSSILEKIGMGAEKTGESTSVCMPRGLIEGGETVLAFTLFLVWPAQAAWLFGAFGSLTFLGAALRVRWAISALPELVS